jgi:hypothetical protein
MDVPDITAIPAEQLTAHQPPALLVERLVAVAGSDGRVRLKPHQGLEPLQLVEACAQALAVVMGARLRAEPGSAGGERASGMLVGAKALRVARRPRPGETVEVEARQTMELGPLQLYAVRVLAGDEELAAGELKVARGQAPSASSGVAP